MNVYGVYLAALHQQDLLEQAQLYRRAKLAPASQPTAAWRRTLRGLFVSAARSLDPSVEVEVKALPADRGADLLPAC